MPTSITEYLIKPMVKGVAAGLFPTLVVLYGINEAALDAKFQEQLLKKEVSDQAVLLQEKVRIIENMQALQEKYNKLLEANIRLVETSNNRSNDSPEES